ncbi:Phage portal protein, SPP1 Gp6-like [Amycolatopsis arida]|uniref:Phage portal protein, SPP1 Gp6-like n=1 Tax=Amycolatopsis arida TaxID=587909 RepID=A0A1I5KCA3_9PSEU|nr:phage portal protein [Amycolatopsis arida]TDX96982.1 SPP1 Gp6-like portal protein [Amycolatopsis arida]SFO82637.1 Phage portal protein, SPP1 Gp6-like [Amycolatopsis arida]
MAIGDVPSQVERQWITRLIHRHNAELPELRRLLEYYEGQQRLSYMHPELMDTLDERVRQVVINWPRLVVDALEERIDLQGFRLGGRPELDAELDHVAQYNDLDAGYQQAHVTAMVMKRAYAIVGTNPRVADERYPLVTIESPLEVHVELDPATRRVAAAIKRWHDLAPDGETQRFVTLYLPEYTVTYVLSSERGGFIEVSRDDHALGEVLVVPIVNRPQLWAPLGTSELDDVIPLSDAACKIATDMMISAEFHAMPRRWALGFDEDDFTDADGKKVSVWQTIAGKIWSTSKTKKDDGVEVGQFNEADLTNFHNTLRALAVMVSTVSGLSLHNLGYSSDNPASADGIRAAEARHVKRAERRIKGFETAWERIMRLVMLVRDGAVPDTARWMETVWADAATPTFSQRSDAVVKLYQADRLVPRRMARRTLGFTQNQIADMEREDREDVTRAVYDPAGEYGVKPAASADEPEAQQRAAEPVGASLR